MLRHVVVPRRTVIQRWCAPNTKTYVILRVTKGVATDIMTGGIAQVYQTVTRRIALQGDGMIGGDGFGAKANTGLTFRVSNANDHQITWGVFASALVALADYMTQSGSAAVAFLVYDGPNEVGQGSIY